MNDVKLLHIKCCFFQFFNCPVALKNKKKCWPPQEKVEMTPLHDHTIRAISQQQVTGLCLLDLSAAFDTIDHSILLQRLKSWFGINNTVLSWIQSYLSSRSFTVNINNIKSSPFQLLYGVPEGSVLGPLLFILYTTPLSHIISRSSVNHKLYADDTQLFLSFSPCNFPQNIQLLQNTIFEISSWMASNFLSLSTPLKLNFYSLVFLRSSLKLIILLYLCLQALSSNLLLLLEILVLSSTQIFPFLITSPYISKPASLTFVILDVFAIL